MCFQAVFADIWALNLVAKDFVCFPLIPAEGWEE